jgi:uncharacterized protein YrrD
MYTTLRDYRFGRDIDDVRGSAVYGPGDEKLGKVDDVIFDSDSGQIKYLVVDTGGWLSSRRFLLPPEELTPSSTHEKDFAVSLTLKSSVSRHSTKKFSKTNRALRTTTSDTALPGQASPLQRESQQLVRGCPPFRTRS